MPAQDGGWVRAKNGRPVISRLDEQGLERLATAGGGLYRRADFRDQDTLSLLEQVIAEGRPRADQEGTQRIWNERYHLLVLMMLAVLLWWYRQSGTARG